MTQKNATPTREQAISISKANLNPADWVVVKTIGRNLLLKHRNGAEWRMIEK